MAISVRKYEDKDLSDMIRIWNEVVEDGVAFPQETPLDKTSGKEFFAAQTYCGVAVTDSGETAGLISSTRTTSGVADTSQTQATPSPVRHAVWARAKNW